MTLSFISESVRTESPIAAEFSGATAATIEAAVEIHAIALAFGWTVVAEGTWSFDRAVAQEGFLRLGKGESLVTVTLDDGLRAWTAEIKGSSAFTSGEAVARVQFITDGKTGTLLSRNREFLMGSLVRQLATGF